MNNMDNNKDNSKNRAGFSAPSDFFEKSGMSIQNKIDWLEEMRDYKMLESLRNQNVFQVPSNYFESTECKLELLGYSHLNDLRTSNPFVVPTKYFQNLSENLSDQILIPIKKQEVFSVPENYFSDGRAQIESLLENKTSRKIIRIWRKPLQWAIAAMFLITLGFWSYSNYNKTESAEDCGTIACIDRNELLQGRELEELDESELYDLVNAKTLEQSLNSGKTAPIKKNDSTEDFSEEDLIDNI